MSARATRRANAARNARRARRRQRKQRQAYSKAALAQVLQEIQRVSGVSKAKAQFILALSARTGLSVNVVTAWVLAEGGADDNPLNIRRPDGGFGGFGSVDAAVKASYDTIHNGLYGNLIRAARAGDERAQIDAITDGTWGTVGGSGSAIESWYGKLSGGGDSNLASFWGDAWDATKKVVPGLGAAAAGVGAADDIVDGVTGAPAAISDGSQAIGSALDAIVKFIARLFQPEFWLRVGKVLMGAIALVVGLILFGNAVLGGGTVQRVARKTPAGKAARTAKRVSDKARGYDPELEADAAEDAKGYEAQRKREIRNAGAKRRRDESKRAAQKKLHTPDDELPF